MFVSTAISLFMHSFLVFAHEPVDYWLSPAMPHNSTQLVSSENFTISWTNDLVDSIEAIIDDVDIRNVDLYIVGKHAVQYQQLISCELSERF